MASTAAAAKLTETYRTAQVRLGAMVVSQMHAAWALLNPEDVDGSFDRWLRVVVPLIQSRRAAAASLAAGYITIFRGLELGLDGADGFRPTKAAAADVEAVTTSMVVTGPVSLRQALERGVELTRAVDVAEARSSAAAMRHVLDGGRETIVATVEADKAALGWARVTSGRACAFCAMVASRGPQYKSQERARFHSHDGCRCGAEPVYHAGADWPAHSERYRELWDTHTAGLSGGPSAGQGGGEAFNAFRRALAQV